jgi:hypothetical protein
LGWFISRLWGSEFSDQCGFLGQVNG